ncbi:MAG: TldD/PmbA family protein [Candidatus Thorarchaeota archaeon]|nr:TldD/PmbA family protein [Candidatus Thorarchaeota archaeon]
MTSVLVPFTIISQINAQYISVISDSTGGTSVQRAMLMEDLAQAAIDAALKTGASFADIRIENTITTIIEITDGVTKRSIASRLKGAGIRAFIDGAWAFAQTTDLTSAGMRETGISVAKLALATHEKAAEKFRIDGPAFNDSVKLKIKTHFDDVPIEDKVGYAKSIDDQARDFDSRIVNTRTIYGDLWTELHIANSLGTTIYLENALPRIISAPTAKEGTSRQQAFKSIGVRGGYEEMLKDAPQTIGETAAKHVVALLDSVTAKGGTFDVVMDPILNGMMVHEAFGHACEADNWPAHATVLEDKVGERVGPNHLNLSDDPTMPGERGSFSYDWEGTKAVKRFLVKEGILTELLHSLETASRLDMKPNGAARAQSFMHEPLPRMSNTFMEPGDWDVDELIQDTKHGILLCSFNYGYTEPAKGQFMFQASHGYMIENGEIRTMVRDVSLAGQILDVLAKVDAVANDFEMDAGTCGKAGQMIPDMSGGPHARVKDIPVGGM